MNEPIRLMPVDDPENTVVDSIPPDLAVNTPDWHRLNARRWALIQKMHRGGLTPEEDAEFEPLQAAMSEVLERTFPRPGLSPKAMAFIRRQLGLAEDAPIP